MRLEHQGRVLCEEFQFLIADRDGGMMHSDAGRDEGFLRFDGAASDSLIVTTGASWGPVQVTAEVSDAPPGVGADWEDVVEVSVRCENGLLVKELFGDPKVGIVDAGGEYRLRVSARGRLQGQERYSSGRGAKILEHYLVEIWPSVASAPQLLRTSGLEVVHSQQVEHHDAGFAAAQRIAADIAGSPGSRTLAGPAGETETSFLFRNTRRRLFPQFSDLTFLTGDGGGLPAPKAGFQFRSSGLGTHIKFSDHSGSRIRIEDDPPMWYRYSDFDSPKFLTLEWHWLAPGASGSRNYVDLVPFLDTPTMVRFNFGQTKSDDGITTTTVHVRHAGLPTEWLDDMQEIWNWKLEDSAKNWNFST